MAIEHSDIPRGEIHGIVNWSVADQAARLAITPVAADVDKVCYQADADAYFVLKNHSPISWVQLNPEAAVVTNVSFDSDTGTLTITLSDATSFVVTGIAAGSTFEAADFAIVERDVNDQIIRQVQFILSAVSLTQNRKLHVQDFDYILGAIPDFAASTAYAAGTLVKYSGSYYIANVAFTSGPTFVSGDWTRVATAVDVTTLEASITAVVNSIAAIPVKCNQTSPAGANPAATGNGALAIGFGAQATDTVGVAVGCNSTAKQGAVALGYNSNANGNDAISIGSNSNTSTGIGAVAVGSYASATYDNSVAVGKLATAYTNGVALGYNTQLTAAGGVVVGENAKASAANAVYLGFSSNPATYLSSAAGAVSVGKDARVTAANGIAVGLTASVTTGEDGIAIGRLSTATGSPDPSIAVGVSANASARGAVVFGASGVASATNAIAIGFSSSATSSNAICIGDASASGSGTFCAGDTASAQANYSIVIGANASDGGASESHRIAIGRYASAVNAVLNAIAFGAYSTASYSNTLARTHMTASTASAGRLLDESLHVTTTNATTTSLKSYGSSLMQQPNDSTKSFYMQLVARQTGGSSGTVGDSKVWEITGVVKRVGSTYSILGTPTSTVLGADAAAAAWTVALSAVAGGLQIDVTGEANKNISWLAKVNSVHI